MVKLFKEVIFTHIKYKELWQDNCSYWLCTMHITLTQEEGINFYENKQQKNWVEGSKPTSIPFHIIDKKLNTASNSKQGQTDAKSTLH